MHIGELTGQVRTHIVESPEAGCALHHHALMPFLQMQRAARTAGIEIEAVSTFRDFERQLSIWNGKFNGARPMLDAAGAPLAGALLPEPARVAAILLWSALPGGSRHHWGTDLDLIDRSAVGAAYRPQLNRAEYSPDGPFARLAAWLAAHASHYGFFRPFKGLKSGVQPEEWHWSFAPVAEPARQRLTAAALRRVIESAPLAGKATVLRNLDALHAHYIETIDLP